MTCSDRLFLQGILESDSVDHGGQQTHVVCRRTIHSGFGPMDPTKDVAPANHDADLDIEIVDLFDFVRDSPGCIHTDSVVLLP